MAKAKKTVGPKEAGMRKMRVGTGNTLPMRDSEGELDTESLFDVDAYQTELDALREKHSANLLNAIDDAKTTRDKAEAELTALQRQLDKVLGRVGVTAVAAKSGGRMDRDTKNDKMVEALKFIAGEKDGVSRADVASAINLDAAKTATVLKALKTDGKADTKGEKSQTKWYAA